jgi:hypothetical protein
MTTSLLEIMRSASLNRITELAKAAAALRK